MAALVLSSAQQALAGSASRSAVVSALTRLKRYFRYNRWLASTNPYLRDTIRNLGSDTRNNVIRSKHLAEYIAASTILHCTDGWGFLARAVSSHVAGDGRQALHLAYYSELRGAMSLLAAEGFGIFSDKHFILDLNGTCHLLPGTTRTHQITWQILDYWSRTPAAAALLGRVLSPGGRQLADWITAFPAGSSANIVGSDFLRTWGIDIQQLANDRDARNEASYRPDRIGTQSHLDAWHSAQFVAELWETFEPSTHLRVAQVDRFLLRVILETTYQSVNGSRRGLKDDLRRMINGFGLSDPLSREWVSFLSRKSQAADPAIVIAARKPPKKDAPEYHTQVMARAALLLRVASGACNELLRDSLISKEEIQFWWSSFGQDRGLWDSSTELVDLNDLWADIEMALSDLRTWIDLDVNVRASRQELLVQRTAEIAVLSSWERMALWATIP